MMKISLALALCGLLAGCNTDEGSSTAPAELSVDHGANGPASLLKGGDRIPQSTAVATLAGGCFWCMETPFEDLPGVSKVTSGYSGGDVVDPTYKAVCSGSTGHAEAIQIHFDPSVIAYSSLLDIFWRQIDPTDGDGQFIDRGSQYRSAIFYHDEQQRDDALASKRALGESGRFQSEIVTEILPIEIYYEAEEYHQDYYEKNPTHYKRYRRGSGRDRYLEQVWGAEREIELPELNSSATYSKPSDEVLRKRLTELQYCVTQEEGTERAFKNEYWDNKASGIYVDIVSGEPLFSSRDKFASGSGWPSFTRPLVETNIKANVDFKIGYARDEVRSVHGDTHLGHVFNDGPKPTGLRYCVNSAALRFIPVSDLKKEGYGQFAKIFE